jgi:hypothetical protein
MKQLVNQLEKLDQEQLSNVNYQQLQELKLIFQQKLSEIENLIQDSPKKKNDGFELRGGLSELQCGKKGSVEL